MKFRNINFYAELNLCAKFHLNRVKMASHPKIAFSNNLLSLSQSVQSRVKFLKIFTTIYAPFFHLFWKRKLFWIFRVQIHSFSAKIEQVITIQRVNFLANLDSSVTPKAFSIHSSKKGFTRIIIIQAHLNNLKTWLDQWINLLSRRNGYFRRFTLQPFRSAHYNGSLNSAFTFAIKIDRLICTWESLYILFYTVFNTRLASKKKVFFSSRMAFHQQSSKFA